MSSSVSLIATAVFKNPHKMKNSPKTIIVDAQVYLDAPEPLSLGLRYFNKKDMVFEDMGFYFMHAFVAKMEKGAVLDPSNGAEDGGSQLVSANGVDPYQLPWFIISGTVTVSDESASMFSLEPSQYVAALKNAKEADPLVSMILPVQCYIPDSPRYKKGKPIPRVGGMVSFEGFLTSVTRRVDPDDAEKKVAEKFYFEIENLAFMGRATVPPRMPDTLGQACGPPDQKTPLSQTYSRASSPVPYVRANSRKWVAAFIVSSFTFIWPMSSSMIAPASTQLAAEFGITSTVTIALVTSIFVLAYAIGPLFLGPLSELYGRSRVIQLANLWYLAWNLGCGFAQNTPQIIAFRFLAGLGGSVPLAIGGAVVGNCFAPEQRGQAIAIYSLALLLGPTPHTIGTRQHPSLNSSPHSKPSLGGHGDLSEISTMSPGRLLAASSQHTAQTRFDFTHHHQLFGFARQQAFSGISSRFSPFALKPTRELGTSAERMISAPSLCVQFVGELEKKGATLRPDYFFVLYMNGKEVLRSENIKLIPVDAIHELTNEAGETISPCILMKLDATVESRFDFMKIVDWDLAHLTTVHGANNAQPTNAFAGQLGAVLQKIVPLINSFGSSHSILKLAWIILSSAYKLPPNQIPGDAQIRGLVESLCELTSAASACPDLLNSQRTVDTIDKIGRTLLDIAGAPGNLLSDMPSQIADCKKRCKDLQSQLEVNVGVLETQGRGHNLQVTGSTFNAIGTSGSVTMVAGNFINGDYNVVQEGAEWLQDGMGKIQGGVKCIQDNQKSSYFAQSADVTDTLMIPNSEEKIEKWISAPDTSLNYKAAREKHQEGTGSWFVEGSDFKRWKHRPDSILWLRGGPGCGKTILCSSAIENIKGFCRGKPSVGYAYFFFDGTSAQSKLANHESLVRAIIMQLSDRFDGIPHPLVELYEDEDNGRSQPILSSLEDTLLRLLQCFGAAYIVIDALDECEERPKVLKWIHSVTSRMSGILHLMVASRPEPDIKNGIRSFSNLLEIDAADYRSWDDIRRYVDVWLSEVDVWTEAQKELVRIALINGAAGVFRWVALMIHELLSDHCLNTSELQNRLRSLPKDLNEAYTKIIQRSTRRADVIRFLQWIIFGKQDFTARKLAEVASINFDASTDILPFYDTNRRYESPDHVLRACSGLVVEVKAKQCASHIESIHDEDIDSIQEEFMQQLTVPSTCCVLVNWSRLRDAGEFFDCTAQLHGAKRQEDFASSLYYASTIGLTPLIEKLIHHGADLNELRGEWGTALQAASYEGHLEIARLLLAKGADDNAMGGQYGTALQAASYMGRLEICRLLLENGTDANATGGQYGTALQAASIRSSLEIVRLLLAKGVNVNLTGGEYGTALQAAAHGGEVAIVKLLLETGADVNATGGKYGTALQAAAYRGEVAIVKLLLETGADVNATGGKYDTALQAASYQGSLEICWLLLAKGADGNATGGQYGTALQAASIGGSLEIARLLLEKGANYGTALQAAAYGGEVAIVKLFLEKGAEVNVMGGKCGSALQAARAICFDEEAENIVQLLKKHGALDVQPDAELDNINQRRSQQ
ncbi:hypothetical protein HWV62_23895 [Athelia sp. TMB]|nr:hypothetical protein HWV62_23895 [Athelia sp. TMB]